MRLQVNNFEKVPSRRKIWKIILHSGTVRNVEFPFKFFEKVENKIDFPRLINL